MELSSTQLTTVLMIMGLAILLCLLFIGLLALRIRAQARQSRALINVMRGEIKAMTTGSIGMGKRLKSIEHRLNLTVEKQQELENRDPTQLAYNQAARLMEMGADIDDLVKNCGIGRPEAELMALLHRELDPQPKQSLAKQH